MPASSRSLHIPAGPGPVPIRDASATTLAHLHGLLDVARTVRREPALDEVMEAVARTVSETLGFKTVVVNLYRSETDDYRVSTVHGSDEAREVLLGKVTSRASWMPLARPGVPAARRLLHTCGNVRLVDRHRVLRAGGR